jgi:hypothetical protein
MPQLLVSARLKEGVGRKALELLEGGPAIDLEDSAFERHAVFIGDERLMFVFENWHPGEDIGHLLRSPRAVWGAARLDQLLEGDLTLHREAFAWERPEPLEGLAFGPDPGPGDSDGGERD